MACEIRVTKPTRKDLAHYADIIHEEMGFTREEALAYLSRKKRDNMLMVTIDGKPAGFLNFLRRGKTIYIRDIDVAERNRRKGLGSALLRGLDAMAIRQGMERLGCHINIDNEVSIRFFTANGFERIRVVKGFYDGKFDAYLFAKRLRNG